MDLGMLHLTRFLFNNTDPFWEDHEDIITDTKFESLPSDQEIGCFGFPHGLPNYGFDVCISNSLQKS